MKKDMKKLVSIVLTGIMCISLAGCAGNQEAKNPNPGGDSTEVTIKISLRCCSVQSVCRFVTDRWRSSSLHE